MSATCPICKQRVGQWQMMHCGPVELQRLMGIEFYVDFEQHFRDVPHTDQQWRAAYFDDMGLRESSGLSGTPLPRESHMDGSVK